MDVDYDHKFEEMKKYIPFLDNMIKRLESTGSGTSNPRQAQLDKIRSLRDLLQDKKKRMKMENLLKCEQVLVNLYAKVEQRDHLSDKSKVTGSQVRKLPDLETVRNKLKCVTMMNTTDVDTLPEIARSSEIAEMCTPGSKEPALFQRRPSSASQLPMDSSSINTRDTTMITSPHSNRRGYTRVLVSPETSNHRWSSNEPTSSNKLFSRRSPKQSPKRSSPLYNNKERKKTSKNVGQKTKKNDLNITLNVPEDSLNSLNTKDILSRIITCSNDDVDIETLRELRTQILGELKQTGANDDISDLILKSYKTKKPGVKEEVEEGELSDSESEAIESIYGSLVVVDKEKSNIVIKDTTEKDQPRKIQICLVINSKDDKNSEQTVKEPKNIIDTCDFDLSNEHDNIVEETLVEKLESDKMNTSCEKRLSSKTELIKQSKEEHYRTHEDDIKPHSIKNKFLETSIECGKIEESDTGKNVTNVDIEKNINDNIINTVKNNKDNNSSCEEIESPNQNEGRIEPTAFKPNFYKPIVNDEEPNKDTATTTEKINEKQVCLSQSNQKPATPTKNSNCGTTVIEHKEKDVNLPFLNEPSISNSIEKDVVSQIDILQALKNEILNENIDIPGSETSTPPLHQPKIVKVASAQKITPNRISIEKYKEKTASSPLFINNNRFSKRSKEDSIKKQSIKLTEKECERFKFTSNIGFDDVMISSEDEVDKNSDTLDNLYDDLAPKSPDLDDSKEMLKAPPVIIPVEPVKAIVVNSKADVDMRTFVSNVLSDGNSSKVNVNSSEGNQQEGLINATKFDTKEGYPEKSKLLDPRIRRDNVQPSSVEKSSVQSTNTEKIPRSTTFSNISTGNLTPNTSAPITPNSTPNIRPLMAPLMTPNSKIYENTPTHPFDIEGNIPNIKHVYAPSFSNFEYHSTRESSAPRESNSQWDCEKNGRRKSRWEDTNCSDPYKNDNVNNGPVIDRYNIDRREDNPRMDCPQTPMPSFGWTDSSTSSTVFNMLDSPMTPTNCFGRIDCPSTPSHPFGTPECPLTPSHPFGRIDCSTTHHLGLIDCPVTPSHPFGRLDCPPTPSHMFGQSDCPPTPVYPFGQPECPSTPVYAFGQSECPPTPVYAFGRADCPPTPSHPFGRFEGSQTPNHSFGRSDFSQNSLNRKISYKDPRLNKNLDCDQGRQSVEKERRYYSDRDFQRVTSYNSHKRPYSNSQSYGKYDREHNIGRNDYNTYYSNEQSGSRFYRETRRETNVSKDRDSNRRYKERDARYNHDSRYLYRDTTKRNYREKSVGRVSSNEENYKSMNKSKNVGIHNKCETNVDKTLSIKSHAGRSFVIDTSVNSTFQNLIHKKEMQSLDYTFDAHRKRASSVGRSLIRESSVSRSVLYDSKSKGTRDKLVENNKNNRYVRARSLGRELGSHSNEKSFQDIKDDFKRYKSQIDTKLSNNIDNHTKLKNDKSSLKSSNTENKSHTSESRNKKDINETNKDEKRTGSKMKSQYFPRKNNRDPRMRGEIEKKAKTQNIDKSRRDERSSGIVYSNDNIAKGTILGSGFGVKNYKIPKIKRVITEIDEKELNVDEKLENTKTTENADVDLDKNNDQSSETEVSKVDEDSTRRVTRSSSKISITKSVDEVSVKTKRTKKPLVYESESESENLVIEKDCDKMLSQETTLISPDENTDKNTNKKCDLNSVFGLEDLDVFSDNIVSDPVIDNINALIADLDNDIDTSKNDLCDGFTKDDTFQSMLNIMDSSETLDHMSKNSMDNINEVINDELNKVNEIEKKVKEDTMLQANISYESCNSKSPKTEDVSQDNLKVDNLSNEPLNVTHEVMCKNKSPVREICENTQNMSNVALNVDTNSELIVSTTDIDVDSLIIVEDKNTVTGIDEENNDRSTPDSTINMNEDVLTKSERKTEPDSTNEQRSDLNSDIRNELNADVTSTNTSCDLNPTDNIKPCSSRQLAPAIDSIGTLLSMLQDKSKIKELVSMLGEKSGENEKIMKKLEKLSEIVSDDEDVNDDMESKMKENVQIGIKDNMTTDVICPSENIIKQSETIEVNYSEKNEESMVTKITNEDSKLPVENALETNLEKETGSDCILTSVNKNVSIENNLVTISNDTIKDSNEEESTHLEEEINKFTEPEKVDKSEEPDKIELYPNAEIDTEKTPKRNTPPVKKTIKKNRRKFNKTNKVNRIARTAAANAKPENNATKKKPSRELMQLQEDIKEMFLNDEILHTTGIRMCRLAKMVDEKSVQKEETSIQDPKPVVVLKKCKEIEKRDSIDKSTKKKPGPKGKLKVLDNNVNVDQEHKNKAKITLKNKVTQKNKSKLSQKQRNLDPYAFESDSVDTFTLNESRDESDQSTDSESASLNSSFSSNELLADTTKTPKRKRRNNAWQSGIIKPKNRKKKIQPDLPKHNELPQSDTVTPDMECFTDKSYCFEKNVLNYSCRLCGYSGDAIVHHYKEKHPHVEIPLSRMNPTIAKEAIAQCKKIDFRVIGTIPTDKYVCRFCYKEFGKGKNVMESFFWHIVSMHTGEYKHSCTECENASNCLDIDIPPPPKDMKGQLIGYICKRCNFTQISVENLKRHVILRHNDEKTDVYKINLAVMQKKFLQSLMNQEYSEPQRVTRSSLTNHEVNDIVNDESDDNDDTNNETSSIMGSHDESPERQTPDISHVKSKITFEMENNFNEPSTLGNNELLSNVKQEEENGYIETESHQTNLENDADIELRETQNTSNRSYSPEITPHTNDIVKCAHFKINYQSSGTKEYVCCINGQDNHYKTSLLISMKKHVQTKHTEIWEGYCTICEVIVTSQGKHSFKDCLQHMLDKHMDEFPILDNLNETVHPETSTDVEDTLPKSYINVRPLAQLITNPDVPVPVDTPVSYPKIDSVVSISSVIELPRSKPSYPRVKKPIEPEKQYKYEEWQAEVMSKKHRVVLETMMTRDKIVQMYKCAGRFCSFTTDNAEGALLHASTHQRIGGENAFVCAYCDFDTCGNAIDLVMHVFKVHGRCQYSCSLCFYRAAASQLVGAHVERVHNEKPRLGSVLRTKPFSVSVAEDSANLLSREDAVEYYYCAHGLSGSNPSTRCVHKSYIADKFVEHLENKHVAPHPCTICTYKADTPTDLIEHMKIHNMNTYQCTWCVHGADNELELMMHASIYHPTKQPNAYVRIITTKENLSELRILPMASFNKINTPVEDVISNISDNPVREAERSLDLEKLIGDIEIVTNEPMISDTPTKETETKDSLVIEVNQSETENHSRTNPPTPILGQLLNRKDTIQINKDVSLIKTDPDEQKPTNDSDVIYCSDSDDGETMHPVIDLSNDDNGADNSAPVVDTCKKISSELLHRCPKCKTIYRSMVGFKKHMVACWGRTSVSSYQCPHFPCFIVLSSVAEVVRHYIKDHKVETGPSFVCGICNACFVSLANVKLHLKSMHIIDNGIVKTTVGPKGNTIHTLYKGNDLPSRKRKLSSKTPKQRRYGPQDVDKLPITPILDDFVYCSLCEFNTKVRLNLVRHLQLHAEQQPAPNTAPVNPVPHLETNEKHFDKMLNLASSSFATRGLDKSRSDTSTSISLVPPETASRYPKFVPERQRYTCGSKGCAYISLSEDMFRCHWETLHSNTKEYHCVHCPPNQQLDTNRPLTVSIIIGHLKMHDIMLYACSSCPYYHYKRQIVEVHLLNLHSGGQVIVVREDSATAGPVLVPMSSAPTMDLKPWQCGLCSFKSMLRPEVAEHCSKVHQSKMQYKCAYCPFRTSTLENVTKHQTNSHPDKNQDVFYYYYREGSVPNDEDGTPLWMKQKQRINPSGLEVKTEVSDASIQTPLVPAAPAIPALSVDLKIVKQETNDTEMDGGEELSITDLCKKYGQFCEPNGIMYKCSLCKVVVENKRQVMQSHLYEELKYRRYSCGICSYKAFHLSGLNEHMASEHKREFQEPVKLPTNVNIEKWVTKYLEYQMDLIKINEDKIAKQKLTVNKVTSGPSQQVNKETASEVQKPCVAELENTFGEFGTPSDMQFSCPKCNFKDKDEHAMREHLENELAKIRWGCNLCSNYYQTYHQAQFHCKSVHTGQSARPVEAVRDPSVRALWVAGVIQSQKLLIDVPTMKPIDDDDSCLNHSDNSLLVVRYEERVPTPEETVRRKRAAPESDDEITVEEDTQKRKQDVSCQYCDFTTKLRKTLKAHVYRHYDLKPFSCSICYLTGHWKTLVNHIEKHHPGLSVTIERTPLPKEPPNNLLLKKRKVTKPLPPPLPSDMHIVCLHCEKSVPEGDIESHVHPNEAQEFARKGEVVVKCCICLALRLDVKSLQEHHNSNHPDIPINYSFFKMHCESRYIYDCGYCERRFKYLRDLKTHHNAMHSSSQFQYSTSPALPGTPSREEEVGSKKKGEEELPSIPSLKRVAKKSTTKLPDFKMVARKSTTKLPVMVYSDDSDIESSHESSYGKKPTSIENYADVTAMMPFCGTIMRFTMTQLTDIITIDPKVIVKDIKNDISEEKKKKNVYISDKCKMVKNE